jgi:hypothetical protein
MPRRRKGLVRALAALTLVVVIVPALGACAGGDDDDDAEVATPGDAPATRTPETTDDAGPGETTTTDDETGDATSLVGQARGDSIGIWSTPDEVGQPDRTLRADEPSGHIVLLVKQEFGPTWLEVYLPTAPAGRTGWIRRDDVMLSRHRFRIEVARAAHTLTVYAGEVSALETPVAVGPDAPEPTDGLFIKELIQTPDAAGPYGRYAYGLSGSSSRAEDFQAGTGVVAIHGTNDEATLGQDVARGSLAIGADELDRLVSSIGLPLGTPVEIVP